MAAERETTWLPIDLPKGWNLRLIEPQDPAANLWDIQRTEEHVELHHECAASNTQTVWNQAKWYEFFLREDARKRKKQKGKTAARRDQSHLQNTTILIFTLITMLTIRVMASSYWDFTTLSISVTDFYAYIWIPHSPLLTHARQELLFSALHMRKLKLCHPTEFIRSDTTSNRDRNWAQATAFVLHSTKLPD